MRRRPFFLLGIQITALLLVLLPFIFVKIPVAHAASSPLAFDSANTSLVSGFNYAKPEALGYVETGINNNIPSYWAGLTNRPAFYARDVAHQLIGAHLL